MTHAPVELDIEYFVDTIQEDSSRIRLAAEWIAKRFALRSFQASISVVDDATIQLVNQEKLNHDWSTDVISFVIESLPQQIDGEVIASAETAQRLCDAAGWSAEDELLLYIVHGLLHVAGLDDIAEPDRQAMRVAEQQCLAGIGVTGADQLPKNWNHVSS